MKLKTKLLTKDSKLPTKANIGDAGVDLYDNKTVTINTGVVGKIPTGIAFAIPKGYWIKLEDRGGFFTNVQLKIGAGIIDNGYTGEIIVCMLNATNRPITIEKGQAFAQAILFELIEATVEEVDSLEETERGGKGFGSSDR